MARGATRDQLGHIPTIVLRSLIREKIHHTLETAVELYAMKNKSASQALGRPARDLLDEWERRGLPRDEPDIAWAYQWLEIGRRYIETQRYENPLHPPALAPSEMAGVEQAIMQRRSVRIWRDEEVPQPVVDRLIEAAAWAPSACNQQPVRFITIRDRDTIRIIPGDGCFEMAPVIIVVLLDRRSYTYLSTIPTYNPVLDAGAAIQNMLLVAYGLGLGTTWGTFGGQKENDAVRARLGVPEHMEMLTYVGLGWPEDFPPPPARLPLRNLQAFEKWSDTLDQV
jgi:nitroreductase